MEIYAKGKLLPWKHPRMPSKWKREKVGGGREEEEEEAIPNRTEMPASLHVNLGKDNQAFTGKWHVPCMAFKC